MAQQKQSGHPLLLPEEPPQASRTLRSLAARLHASLWTIPFYPAWTILRVVPPKKQIARATRGLVQWSNSLYEGDPVTANKDVAKALNLPVVE